MMDSFMNKKKLLSLSVRNLPYDKSVIFHLYMCGRKHVKSVIVDQTDNFIKFNTKMHNKIQAKHELKQPQLTALKNQIRAQRNLVRPYQQQIFPLARQRSTKRLFKERYHQTSISDPPQERSETKKTPTKRCYDKSAYVHVDQHRNYERRHFGDTNNDRLTIAIHQQRKTSAYLNTKLGVQEGIQNNTSLLGIGQRSKSTNLGIRTGKKIFSQKR